MRLHTQTERDLISFIMSCLVSRARLIYLALTDDSITGGLHCPFCPSGLAGCGVRSHHGSGKLLAMPRTL